MNVRISYFSSSHHNINAKWRNIASINFYMWISHWMTGFRFLACMDDDHLSCFEGFSVVYSHMKVNSPVPAGFRWKAWLRTWIWWLWCTTPKLKISQKIFSFLSFYCFWILRVPASEFVSECEAYLLFEILGCTLISSAILFILDLKLMVFLICAVSHIVAFRL